MIGQGKTLLIDGNNLLMRAIFATHRSPMNADGVPTGPLLVFLNTLAKHIREEAPGCVAVAWDGGRSIERVALDAGYKGNREGAPDEEIKLSSFALAKELLTLVNVYQVEMHGREADDLIAGWWARAEGPVTILSSDKDFLQLLGENPHGHPVDQVRLSSPDTPTDRWTEERMIEELGHGPMEWAFITALTGDKSDNVIGVPGIGPVKALKLLNAHQWNWDAALADPKVAGHADQVRINLRLVSLRQTDLKLSQPPCFAPTRPGEVMHDLLVSFVDRYRLASVRDRLVTGGMWTDLARSRTIGRPLRSS